jgi:SAM-dependent methyltransferase
MPEFKDYFSNLAQDYRAYRPHYPQSLANYLAEICPSTHLAWEAGCGSGQLTTLLGEVFEHVVATDPSAEQLKHATVHPRVKYFCRLAQESNLPDKSVDLAVAAQAAHWFDLPLYYQEVNRVLRSGGIIALISYGKMSVNEEIDKLINHFYATTLENYWPPERKLIEDGYQSLLFPFQEIKTPTFSMEFKWSFQQVVGYLHSWSATRALEKAEGKTPFTVFSDALLKIWGAMDKKYTITWPLALRVGRV